MKVYTNVQCMASSVLSTHKLIPHIDIGGIDVAMFDIRRGLQSDTITIIYGEFLNVQSHRIHIMQS